MKKIFFPASHRPWRGLAHAALWLGASVGALAATSVANQPIFGGESNVKPNVMVLMDTSNSMSWTHMPDSVERETVTVADPYQRIGYKSYRCNSIYYDPARTYTIPRDATGAALPTPSFNDAYYDYYIDPGKRVDLRTQFQAYDKDTLQYQSGPSAVEDPKQPAYYYRYKPTAAITQPHCDQVDTVAGVNNTQWQKMLVTGTSAQQQQNFAIWYSYYRTRMALAKSSLAQAFLPLSDAYRIGFITVNPTQANNGMVGDAVHADRYLPLADFTETQKLLWYSKMFGQAPYGSSPAREGLARVGRHYGGKTDGINQGMPEDPVISACQPNFTIMTTDGYWNSAAEKSFGGPVRLDGTTRIGQQDNPWTGDTGLVPYGVYDGNRANVQSTKYVKKEKAYQTRSCEVKVAGRSRYYIEKTVTHYQQVQSIPPGNNASVPEQYDSQWFRKTWSASETLRQTKRTQTSIQRTESAWRRYDALLEQEVACSPGSSDCQERSDTRTVYGTCSTVPEVIPGATVTCAPPHVVTTYTAPGSCSNDPSQGITCETAVIGPQPSSACSANGSTWVPNLMMNGNAGAQRECTVSAVQEVATANSCNTAAEFPTPGQGVSCRQVINEWREVSSCTPAAADVPPYKFVECRSKSVCVPNASNNFSCAPTVTPVGQPGGSCIPQQPNAQNNWTTTTCETRTVSVDRVGSCTPSLPGANNKWLGAECKTIYTEGSSSAGIELPEGVACTAETASVSNNWVRTVCNNNVTKTGLRLQFRTRDITTTEYAGGTVVGPTNGSWTGWANEGGCVLPPNTVEQPPTEVTEEPPVIVAGANYTGSTDSLADVAQYYYKTDLRPNMPDRVKPSGMGWGDDRATWQHMTTFVVGLGVSGTINFQDDYMTAASGDFANIRTGVKGWPIWPANTAEFYASNPTAYNARESIDDFWHAAVNGRGRYFSANNPETLMSGIRGALAQIDAAVAVGSGASFDNPVSPGQAFGSSYVSSLWTGDVQSTAAPVWSAKDKLNAMMGVNGDCDNRKIYYRGSVGTLAEFTWGTRKCNSSGQPTGSASNGLEASLRALFDPSELDHYATMTDGTDGTANQRSQATGQSLVNYLRGQRQHEDFAPGVSGKLYRKRNAVLGDIVNSKPVYVKGAKSNYADAGYHGFKASAASRKAMVYVGANDGMLHAFYAPSSSDGNTAVADAGKEAWAYVPRQVMANMHKLANTNYASRHRYFVDGTPVVGDVKASDGWKTILVGGLNAGGEGYYALDITDPDDPKSLWEFNNTTCASCDMGLSFGKPVISKLKNGTWAVFVASGYNNSSGKGLLYVLNAVTGELISTIDTGVGTAASPAGLAHIAGYAKFQQINNTVERLYGGDLLGNIWRFDVNSSTPRVDLVGVAQSPGNSGTPQPITVPPVLATMNKKEYVVLGTGKLLDTSDAASTQVHTIYAIVDPLSPVTAPATAVYADLRGSLTKFKMTADLATECDDTTAACTGKHSNGWYIDLVANAKEQVNLEMMVSPEGTLVVGTNEPLEDVCSFTGHGRVYFLDLEKAVNTDDSLDLGDTYLVGMDISRDPDGKTRLTGTGGNGERFERTLNERPTVQGNNRMSWRELTGQ